MAFLKKWSGRGGGGGAGERTAGTIERKEREHKDQRQPCFKIGGGGVAAANLRLNCILAAGA